MQPGTGDQQFAHVRLASWRFWFPPQLEQPQRLSHSRSNAMVALEHPASALMRIGHLHVAMGPQHKMHRPLRQYSMTGCGQASINPEDMLLNNTTIEPTTRGPAGPSHELTAPDHCPSNAGMAPAQLGGVARGSAYRVLGYASVPPAIC